MFRFLQQPYPLASLRSKLLTPLAFGAFIALFLLVFRPFGLSQLAPGRMLGAAAGYGLVTFGVIFLEIWTGPLLMPAYFREASWTVGREIFVTLTDVFVIGLGNLVFSTWYLQLSFTAYAMIWFQVVTVIVGVLPLAIWTLYSQLRLQKRYSAAANALHERVQERMQPAAPAGDAAGPATAAMPLNTAPVTQAAAPGPVPVVQLSAEQGGDTLQLPAQQLLYIAAADNYIKVYHLENGVVRQTMLRSTLKRAAAALEGHPLLFRCHRTFLVNLAHVMEISGNAQGLKLQLAYTGAWVPVSRSLHEEIRRRL